MADQSSITYSADLEMSRIYRRIDAAAKYGDRAFNRGFKLDTSGISRPLGQITADFSQFDKSLNSATARVLAFGATTGVIFAVKRAFEELISSTIEVERSLQNINVIFNLSAASLSKFGSSLFEISRNTATSFDEVAKAASEFSRQGLGFEQTLIRTRDAAILARQSNLGLEESVRAITSTLNSFQKEVITSTELINRLANVDASFAVSSADLAAGISRVGSSAEDAGVNLSSLLGLITSAAQTTGRSGEVIGNALKSIFVRVGRSSTLEQLRGLGVAINESQDGVTKLKALADALDTVSISQANQIKEAAGGVYQFNIINALLKDLTKNNGIYAQSQNVATQSTDEAIKRNERLNQTISALVTKTKTNFTELGASIGKVSIAPFLDTILKSLNTGLEGINKTGNGPGKTIGQGILTGITQVLTGPGAAIFLAVIGKLLFVFAKDVKGALGSLIHLNRSLTAQTELQNKIVSVLNRDKILRQEILSGTISTADVESRILETLRRQSQEKEKLNRLAFTVAKNASQRTSGFVGNDPNSPLNKGAGFGAGFQLFSPTDRPSGRVNERFQQFGKGSLSFLSLGGGASSKAETPIAGAIRDSLNKTVERLNKEIDKGTLNTATAFDSLRRFALRLGLGNDQIRELFVSQGHLLNANLALAKARNAEAQSSRSSNFFGSVQSSRLSTLEGLTSRASSVNPFNLIPRGPGGLSSIRARRELEQRAKTDPDAISALATARGNIQSRVQTGALIGGISGPVLTGIIEKSIDQTTKSGRLAAAKASGAGDILSYTALGAGVGGAAGAVAGFSVGSISAISKILKEARDNTTEYIAALEKASSATSKLQDNLAQFEQIEREITDILSGTVNATSQQLLDKRDRRLEILTNLGPDTARKLSSNRSDPSSLTDVISLLSRESVNNTRVKEFNLGLTKASDTTRFREDIVTDDSVKSLQSVIRSFLNIPGQDGKPIRNTLETPEIADLFRQSLNEALVTKVEKGVDSSGKEIDVETVTIDVSKIKEALELVRVTGPVLDSTLNTFTKVGDKNKDLLEFFILMLENSVRINIPAAIAAQAELDKNNIKTGQSVFNLTDELKKLGQAAATSAIEIEFETRAQEIRAEGARQRKDETARSISSILQQISSPVSAASFDLNSNVRSAVDQFNTQNNSVGGAFASDSFRILQDLRKVDLKGEPGTELIIKKFGDRIEQALKTGTLDDLKEIVRDRTKGLILPDGNPDVKALKIEDEVKDKFDSAIKTFEKTLVENNSKLQEQIDIYKNTYNIIVANHNLQKKLSLGGSTQDLSDPEQRLNSVRNSLIEKQIGGATGDTSTELRGTLGFANFKNEAFGIKPKGEERDRIIDLLEKQIQDTAGKITDLKPGEARETATLRFKEIFKPDELQETLDRLTALFKSNDVAIVRALLNDNTPLINALNEKSIKESAPIPEFPKPTVKVAKGESEFDKKVNNVLNNLRQIESESNFVSTDAQPTPIKDNELTTKIKAVLRKVYGEDTNSNLNNQFISTDAQPKSNKQTPGKEVGTYLREMFKLLNEAQLKTKNDEEFVSTDSQPKTFAKTTMEGGDENATRIRIEKEIEERRKALNLLKPSDERVANKIDESRVIEELSKQLKELQLEKLNVENETIKRDKNNFFADDLTSKTFQNAEQRLLKGPETFDLQKAIDEFTEALNTFSPSDALREAYREAARLQETLKDSADLSRARQRGRIFSEDFAQDNFRSRQDRILQKDPNFKTGKETLQTFGENLDFKKQDAQNLLLKDAIDLAHTLKLSFSDSFKSFIDGTKDAEDAFKGFATSVLQRISDLAVEFSTESLFGGISSLFDRGNQGQSFISSIFSPQHKAKGGPIEIQGYSYGGVVKGGSGIKDDVPALLTAGEYVINKRAVQKYGEDYLEGLNSTDKYAQQSSRSRDAGENGVDLILKNSYGFNDALRPTGGFDNIDKELSNFAQTDENNPQNAIKFSRQEDLVNYLLDRDAFEKEKEEALKRYKKGKKQRLIGSYINLGVGLAGAGLGSLKGSPNNTGDTGLPKIPGVSAGYGRAKGGLIPQTNKFISKSKLTKPPKLEAKEESTDNKKEIEQLSKDFFKQYNSLDQDIKPTSPLSVNRIEPSFNFIKEEEKEDKKIEAAFKEPKKKLKKQFALPNISEKLKPLESKVNFPSGKTYSGAMKSKTSAQFAVGGYVEPKKYKDGGKVWGGQESSDKQRALLTGGEFVMKKSAVDKLGSQFLDKINEQKLDKKAIKGYAAGGLVGGNNYSQQTSSDGSADILTRIADSTELLSKNIGNNKQDSITIQKDRQNSIVNNVNISVNIDRSGNNKTTNSENSNSEKEKSSPQNDREQSKQMAEALKGEILKVLNQQLRNGGILSNVR